MAILLEGVAVWCPGAYSSHETAPFQFSANRSEAEEPEEQEEGRGGGGETKENQRTPFLAGKPGNNIKPGNVSLQQARKEKKQTNKPYKKSVSIDCGSPISRASRANDRDRSKFWSTHRLRQMKISPSDYASSEHRCRTSRTSSNGSPKRGDKNAIRTVQKRDKYKKRTIAASMPSISGISGGAFFDSNRHSETE